MNFEDITFWTEVEEFLPPLSSSDYKELKKNIEDIGIQIPIQVLPDGRIIDGLHRFKIAKELELKDSLIPKEIKEIDEETAFSLAISLNLARRHLSFTQKKELIKKLRKRGLTQAKVAKIVGIGRSTVSENETKDTTNVETDNACNEEKPDASIADLRYKIPKEIQDGIAHRIELGEDQAQIASDYGITQQRVSQINKKIKARTPKPQPPINIVEPQERHYKTLIIDPPWPTKKIEREARPKQGKFLDYPTMSIEKIKSLDIQKWGDKNGCHIYLWTTHKFLPIAFEIFNEWHVKYECLLTWVKNVGFTPFSWMYSTEHILFGRIGSLPLLKKGIRLDFKAIVRQHSRKPEEFFDIVRIVSPEPRLELFSREKRKGFDQYGDEVTKYER